MKSVRLLYETLPDGTSHLRILPHNPGSRYVKFFHLKEDGTTGQEVPIFMMTTGCMFSLVRTECRIAVIPFERFRPYPMAFEERN